MNVEPLPHTAFHTPPSNNNPPDPSPKSQIPTRGRPRVLDDLKRGEICALVAGGCSLREAARYVRCGLNTIRRELKRNAEFSESLRRSQMYAQLSPLRAMQQAVATHWRAAAWMLERAYPDRFAHRDPVAFNARQARSLLNEILTILSSEIIDPFQRERIEKRLRATFEYTIRTACDSRRTSRELRQAMQFFERKDRLNDPLAPFGGSSFDLTSLFDPRPRQASQSANTRPSQREAAAHSQPTPGSATIANLAKSLGEHLRSTEPQPAQTKVPVPRTDATQTGHDTIALAPNSP